MKNAILLSVTFLLAASVAFAGTIKPNGMNQKDLYNLLNKVVAMVNEIKADHNGIVADMTAASGIKTQFGTYSTSMKARTTSSSDLSLTQ